MGFINRNVVALVLMAIFVTIPLAYFGLRPIYLTEISVQERSSHNTRLVSNVSFTRTDDNGVVYFDFQAFTNEPNAKLLYFEIRPAVEPKFYRQGAGYKVVEGMVSGVAQLGSKQWPLHQDEQYYFRLVDSKERILIEGRIMAKVYPVAGISQMAILLIGFFASILQIIVTIWPKATPQRDSAQ